MYGTHCATPEVQQLLREQLEGNPGALADFFNEYYGLEAEKQHELRIEQVFGDIEGYRLAPENGRGEKEPSPGQEPLPGGGHAVSGPKDGRTPPKKLRQEAPESAKDGSGPAFVNEGPIAEQHFQSGALAEEERQEWTQEVFPTVQARESPVELEGGKAQETRVERIESTESSGEEEDKEADEEESQESRDWSAWHRFLRGSSVSLIRDGIRACHEKAKEKATRGGFVLDAWFSLMKTMIYKPDWVPLDQVDFSLIEPKFHAIRGSEGVPRSIKCAYNLVRRVQARYLDVAVEEHRLSMYKDEYVRAGLAHEVEEGKVPAIVGLLAERFSVGLIAEGSGYKRVLNIGHEVPVHLVTFREGMEQDAANRIKQKFLQSGEKRMLGLSIPASEDYEATDLILSLWEKIEHVPGESLHFS